MGYGKLEDRMERMCSDTHTHNSAVHIPESRYSASYKVDTETKMLKGTVGATLKQSSYYNAVKSATFRERNHPQKTKKTLTY